MSTPTITTSVATPTTPSTPITPTPDDEVKETRRKKEELLGNLSNLDAILASQIRPLEELIHGIRLEISDAEACVLSHADESDVRLRVVKEFTIPAFKRLESEYVRLLSELKEKKMAVCEFVTVLNQEFAPFMTSTSIDEVQRIVGKLSPADVRACSFLPLVAAMIARVSRGADLNLDVHVLPHLSPQDQRTFKSVVACGTFSLVDADVSSTIAASTSSSSPSTSTLAPAPKKKTTPKKQAATKASATNVPSSSRGKLNKPPGDGSLRPVPPPQQQQLQQQAVKQEKRIEEEKEEKKKTQDEYRLEVMRTLLAPVKPSALSMAGN